MDTCGKHAPVTRTSHTAPLHSTVLPYYLCTETYISHYHTRSPFFRCTQECSTHVESRDIHIRSRQKASFVVTQSFTHSQRSSENRCLIVWWSAVWWSLTMRETLSNKKWSCLSRSYISLLHSTAVFITIHTDRYNIHVLVPSKHISKLHKHAKTSLTNQATWITKVET